MLSSNYYHVCLSVCTALICSSAAHCFRHTQRESRSYRCTAPAGLHQLWETCRESSGRLVRR